MGLNIIAYKNTVKVTDESVLAQIEISSFPQDEAFRLGLAIPSINSDFPGREDGLEPVPYSFEEKWEFRAGSYLGYSLWRNDLANLIGIKDLDLFWEECQALPKGAAPKVPFGELLWFSDCEGSLGPLVCQKLFKDFCEWGFDVKNETASSAYSRESLFWLRYQDWKTAFDFGSTGWVEFV